MKRFDVRSALRRWLALAVLGGTLVAVGKAAAAAAPATNAAPYLAAVRQFADQVLAHGRDVYGKTTPLFVDGLNVDTREPVKWKWADGTSMEGYVCKKDGYFGPKGRKLTAVRPEADHLWVYALAFRLSGDAYLWEMARNIARSNGWGDIGECVSLAHRMGEGRGEGKATPKLRFAGNVSDPRLLFALLELHRASGNAAFLTQAETIGQNILKQRIRGGWFVPSQRHVFCRVANGESQALLHLAAALLGKPEAMPAFTGAEPFFHAEYGNSTGRVYDSADIYGRTR